MSRRFAFGSSFGVMQGRLSRQSNLGYQVFPWETWQREFTAAAALGLEHIEWVLDSWRASENPLVTNQGEVRQVIGDSGVSVISVCADYLMDTPLDAGDSASWTLLGHLITAMQDLGAIHLVLPCVDQSSLRIPASYHRFQRAAEVLSTLLVDTKIKVSLECDLDPVRLHELLGKLDPDVFGINYDIGNSAHLGYSLDQEFNAYGSRISLVHIKDRILGQGSVFLGTGDADIPRAFKLLLKQGFCGPITMQAHRDTEGVRVLKQQLAWIESQLEDLV